MSKDMSRYRELMAALAYTRWVHLGQESEEEDGILEEMDVVWWKMTAEEREEIDVEPSLPDFGQILKRSMEGWPFVEDRMVAA